jgi:hypothetical protein
MDPAGIIGTTAVAVQFVASLSEIVSLARKVHHADGELDEHKRLRDAASDLEPAIVVLLEKSKSQTPLSPVEKSLLQVAQQCQDVSNGIFRLLDSYQVGPVSQIGHEPPSSKTLSTRLLPFKNTIKTTSRIIRSRRDEEGLRQDFDRCISLLNIHLNLLLK